MKHTYIAFVKIQKHATIVAIPDLGIEVDADSTKAALAFAKEVMIEKIKECEKKKKPILKASENLTVSSGALTRLITVNVTKRKKRKLSPIEIEHKATELFTIALTKPERYALERLAQIQGHSMTWRIRSWIRDAGRRNNVLWQDAPIIEAIESGETNRPTEVLVAHLTKEDLIKIKQYASETGRGVSDIVCGWIREL